jgi:hypothetical protein
MRDLILQLSKSSIYSTKPFIGGRGGGGGVHDGTQRKHHRQAQAFARFHFH